MNCAKVNVNGRDVYMSPSDSTLNCTLIRSLFQIPNEAMIYLRPSSSNEIPKFVGFVDFSEGSRWEMFDYAYRLYPAIIPDPSIVSPNLPQHSVQSNTTEFVEGKIHQVLFCSPLQ